MTIEAMKQYLVKLRLTLLKIWATVIDVWSLVVERGYTFYVALAVIALISSKIIIVDGKSELLPTLWISVIAAGLSFNSYVYAKEKFRLDLLDKRWVIYEKTLEFCSVVIRHATLVPNERNQDSIFQGMQAAEACFRGIGYHKTLALFDADINDVFKKLNESYAWLSSGHTFQSDPNFAANKNRHVMFVWDTANKLPDLFKPYVYFGDYKRHIRTN